MFDRGTALRDRFEHRVKRRQRHFRQKSERTEVDAEQRNIDRGSHSRRRQQRPIAPEDNDEIQRVRRHLRSGNDFLISRVFRSLHIDDDFIPALDEPREQPWNNLRDGGAIWPRNDGRGFLGGRLRARHGEKRLYRNSSP